MYKVYYSQLDSRWKNHLYPSRELPRATIGSGGCGPTCAAMIVSMLKKIVLPSEMGDLFVRDGIRVNGGTSNEAFNTYLTKTFGLQMTTTYDLSKARECLQRGGLVVTLCGKGLFTDSGHFVVLAGFNNDEFLVYDPYLYSTKFTRQNRLGKVRAVGTDVYVPYSNMKAYGNYGILWCYEPTGIDTNPNATKPLGKVAKVQKYLNDSYSFGILVDNIAGNQTMRAIIKALQIELNKQYKKDIAEDGLFGKQTLNACITLRQGAKGKITALLQCRLACLGYNITVIDGIFGNQTAVAVKQFQANKKIVTDGVVGKQTWHKLF